MGKMVWKKINSFVEYVRQTKNKFIIDLKKLLSVLNVLSGQNANFLLYIIVAS